MKHKGILKQLITWLSAFAISFIVANFLISFYFYDPGWIKRDTGATRGIYEPGSTIVRADEGFTITHIDRNGYINESADLTQSGYVLVLGNSQSNGCNVMPEKKWISLLNGKIQSAREERWTQVYNLSVGGYQLWDQLRGVSAAVEEFPDSKALIIQVLTTDIEAEELDGIEQRIFTEESRGGYLSQHLSVPQIVRNGIKDFFPLVVYLSELKLPKIDLTFPDAFFHASQNSTAVMEKSPGGGINNEEQVYRETLDRALAFLRDSYDEEIIILNIPGIVLQADGTVVINAGQYESTFQAVCEQNGITYYNVGRIYQKEYDGKAVLPYRFSNTRPGYGHLNEDGHQMTADALYALLTERGVVQ